MLLTIVAAGCIITATKIPASWYEDSLVGPLDNSWYGAPNQIFTDQCVQDGELPLWNPLLLCGTPHAANPQVHFFYPPNLVRSFLTLHPSPWKTHAGLVLLWVFHVHLAALGAFALARSHNLGFFPSLVTALTFVFGRAYLSLLLGTVTLAPSLSWMPLLLLCGRRAFLAETGNARYCWSIAGGLIFGMVLLAGYPPFAVYAGVLFALYGAVTWVLKAIHGSERQQTGHRRFSFASLLWTGGIVAVVGSLVAMALLLPASEFFAASTRARGVGYQEGRAFFLSLRLNVSTLTALRDLVVFPGTKSASLMPGAGILYAILALTAVSGRHGVKSLPYFILILAALDCAIGPRMPLASLLDAAAPFQMSNWILAIHQAALPLSLLAGFGVETLAASTRNRRDGLFRTLFLVAAGGLAVSLASEADEPVLPLEFVHLAVPIAGILVMVLAVWVKRPGLWRAVLGALIFAELMTWTTCFVPKHFIPGERLALFRPFPKGLGALDAPRDFGTENRRGIGVFPTNHCMYCFRPIVNGYDPLHLRRTYDVLACPQWEGKYIRALFEDSARRNPRWSLFLARPFWLTRRSVAGPLPPRERLFPPAGTVFLPEVSCSHVPQADLDRIPNRAVSPNAAARLATDPALLAALAAPTHVRSAEGNEELVYRLPLAEEAGVSSILRLEYQSAGDAIISATVLDIDGTCHYPPAISHASQRDESHLELPLYGAKKPQEVRLVVMLGSQDSGFEFLSASFLTDPEDEDDKICITRRTANSVEVRLDALPDWRVLLFTDAFYPGWRAFVDGSAVPIMLANDAFKAIEVPPGTHNVRFEFRSVRVTVGIVISLTTLAVATAYLARAYWRARHARHQ